MHDTGFLVLPGVLTSGELSLLRRDLAVEPGGRAGLRHLMGRPAVRDIARHRTLMAVARRWAGPGAVPYRATLFNKDGDRNWLVAWHQDTALPLGARTGDPDWGPWSEKAGVLYAHAPARPLSRIVALRIHLDDSTRDNGPLRVIPGSHRLGVLEDEDVHRLAHASRAVECVAGAGGVLAMRPLLIHASSKARTAAPRRVLHLEYAPSLELAPGLRLAVA